MPDGMVTIDVISRGQDSTLGVDNSFPGNDVRISGLETTGADAVKEKKSGLD